MKKDAGRPAIDTAYRIRAMAWFNAVSLASGMNDGELEVLFGGYAPGARPGLWRKYKTGRICPKFKPDIHGHPSIVERVEPRFPGTAKWMTMPFWEVLSYKPMDMAELRRIYLSLSPTVRDLIVTEPKLNGRMFWRRMTETESLYQDLADIGDLDAATAILALIKEAEVTQNQTQHQWGLIFWSRCSSKLTCPVVSPLLHPINAVIEDRFTRITYLTSEGKYSALSKEKVSGILASSTSPPSDSILIVQPPA